MNSYQELQLDALGDATRRAILARLLNGPLSVQKIAGRVSPKPSSHFPQHLRILKSANLVIDQADGNRRVYQIHPEGFETLREYFEQFWRLALDAFNKKVEEEEDD